MVLALIGTVVGAIGGIFKGIFNFKGKQADVLQQAIKAASDVSNSEAQREMAQAQILVAEMSSGNLLASSWRPIFVYICMAIIVSFWFGYVPEGLNTEMPPMVSEVFSIIKIAMGGYIGGRTVEKIFNSLNIGKALKKYIEKKIV